MGHDAKNGLRENDTKQVTLQRAGWQMSSPGVRRTDMVDVDMHAHECAGKNLRLKGSAHASAGLSGAWHGRTPDAGGQPSHAHRVRKGQRAQREGKRILCLERGMGGTPRRMGKPMVRARTVSPRIEWQPAPICPERGVTFGRMTVRIWLARVVAAIWSCR